MEKIPEAFECDGLPPLKKPAVPGDFILDHENREPGKLTKDGKEHRKYRRLVGQTLWLSSVRRDTAYSVKELSKFVHDPTEDDVKKGYHLLRYIRYSE